MRHDPAEAAGDVHALVDPKALPVFRLLDAPLRLARQLGREARLDHHGHTAVLADLERAVEAQVQDLLHAVVGPASIRLAHEGGHGKTTTHEPDADAAVRRAVPWFSVAARRTPVPAARADLDPARREAPRRCPRARGSRSRLDVAQQSTRGAGHARDEVLAGALHEHERDAPLPQDVDRRALDPQRAVQRGGIEALREALGGEALRQRAEHGLAGPRLANRVEGSLVLPGLAQHGMHREAHGHVGVLACRLERPSRVVPERLEGRESRNGLEVQLRSLRIGQRGHPGCARLRRAQLRDAPRGFDATARRRVAQAGERIGLRADRTTDEERAEEHDEGGGRRPSTHQGVGLLRHGAIVGAVELRAGDERPSATPSHLLRIPPMRRLADTDGGRSNGIPHARP